MDKGFWADMTEERMAELILGNPDYALALAWSWWFVKGLLRIYDREKMTGFLDDLFKNF